MAGTYRRGMRGDLGKSPFNNLWRRKRFGLIDLLATIIPAR
jgi:hypothetical protein